LGLALFAIRNFRECSASNELGGGKGWFFRAGLNADEIVHRSIRGMWFLWRLILEWLVLPPLSYANLVKIRFWE